MARPKVGGLLDIPGTPETSNILEETHVTDNSTKTCDLLKGAHVKYWGQGQTAETGQEYGAELSALIADGDR